MDRCARPLGIAATVVFVAALAACRFDTSGSGPPTDLVPDSATIPEDVARAEADTFVTPEDGAPAEDSTIDSAMDVVTDTAPPFCDETDTTLVACYRFESNGDDESSHGNHATITSGKFVPGVDGMALELDPTKTTAMVSENASLAVGNQLTIEAWIKLKSLPRTGSRVGIVDDDGRFGFFVYAPGVLHVNSPTVFEDSPALPTNTWTHVAFTYDGKKIVFYVDGKQVSEDDFVGTFGGASGAGMALGMNSPSGDVMDGAIDSVRVFSIARTAAQICAAAGAC